MHSAFAGNVLRAERKPQAPEIERLLTSEAAETYHVAVWKAARWKHLNWNFLIGALVTLLVSGITWGSLIYFVLKAVR
jgi:hypothetical protein